MPNVNTFSYTSPTRRTIILSDKPRGVYVEGVITGTPKPGVVVNQSSDGTWVPYAGSTGERNLICVLLPDSLQGKTVDDAYVTATRCFMYCPAPGELLMMLLKNISGTGDLYPIGSKMIVETATGKLLITASTPESEPFNIYGEIPNGGVALTADTLAIVQYTGH